MKCLCAVVPKAEGESIRLKLSDSNNLRTDVRIASDNKFVYLPIVSEKGIKYPLQEKDLDEIEQPVNYKDLLRLPPDLMLQLPTSFDIVGDVFLLKLFEELKPYAKDIADALLETNRHAKVVTMDMGVQGEFRTRELKVLAGEHRTVTIHKEYGIRYEVDLAKVYFSPRLATERKRITDMAQPGERILDMFCGIGPFSLMLAKSGKPSIVYSIDKNPEAINYLIKNIKVNKINGVSPMLGDARAVAPRLPRPDRIIMNLPHTAIDFLDLAFERVNPGGNIHFYSIQEEDTLDIMRNAIQDLADSMGRRISVDNVQEVHTYSPSQCMYCFDISVD